MKPAIQHRIASPTDILFCHSLQRVAKGWMGGNKLFCPIFHPAPGHQIQFSTKSLQWERKENKHRISVQRWISNSLERGWWRRAGRDWLAFPPASAAFWLQPNVKALSQNGHPVWEFPEYSTNADKPLLVAAWIFAASGNLRICSWMSGLWMDGYRHALETPNYITPMICEHFGAHFTFQKNSLVWWKDNIELVTKE